MNLEFLEENSMKCFNTKTISDSVINLKVLIGIDTNNSDKYVSMENNIAIDGLIKTIENYQSDFSNFEKYLNTKDAFPGENVLSLLRESKEYYEKSLNTLRKNGFDVSNFPPKLNYMERLN